MKPLIPPPRQQAVERCPTDKQVFKSSWYSTLGLCLKDLNYKDRITTEISVWQVLHGAQCILLSFFGQACYQTGLVCDTGTGRKRVLGLKKHLATEKCLKQLLLHRMDVNSLLQHPEVRHGVSTQTFCRCNTELISYSGSLNHTLASTEEVPQDPAVIQMRPLWFWFKSQINSTHLKKDRSKSARSYQPGFSYTFDTQKLEGRSLPPRSQH